MKNTNRIIALSLSIVLILLSSCSLIEKPTVWKTDIEEETPVTERVYDTDYELMEPSAEDFKVAKYYQNNMVLQRDKNIVVWGTADESQNGKVVCAEFKGVKGSGVIENGKWEIIMKGTFSASSDVNSVFKVYGKGKEVEFNGVLVGDIWVLNGQSNAVITFNTHVEYMQYYKDYLTGCSADDNYRILYQDPNLIASQKNKNYPNELQEDVLNKWFKPSKAIVSSSPMIASFFAKKMTELNPDVPIGIISTCMGGVPLNHLASYEALQEFDSSLIYGGTTINGVTLKPSCIYNTLIAPLTKMAITGMIMFQGESDGPFYNAYDDGLRSIIKDYRLKFGTNFLFINMQLCSYGIGTEGLKSNIWDYVNDIRNAQSILAIDGTINNYKVITTFDCGFQDGDVDEAHPTYKKPISERAAEVAASVIYGIGDENDVGCPIPSEISYTKNSVKITFDNYASGLTLSSGTVLKGFEVKYMSEWHDATEITINGNTVEITGIEDPQGVRYAYDLFYRTTENANLVSGTGRPASAFSVEF